MRAIEFGVDRAPQSRASAIDPGRVRSLRDAWMVTCAWTLLAVAELVMRMGGFGSVFRVVRAWPHGRRAPSARHQALVRDASAALIRARTLYVKRTRCLQRGVALTCLLRLWGVPAQLVIGVQKMPFYAHAWVEVNGTVVSDGGAPVTMYREMTRC